MSSLKDESTSASHQTAYHDILKSIHGRNPHQSKSGGDHRHMLYGQDRMSERITYLAKVEVEKILPLRELLKTGPYRSVAVVDERAYERIDVLAKQAPNFSEFLAYVKGALALANFSLNRAIQLQPVLFLGDPGLGKSWLCQKLANIMAMEFTTINVGSLTASFELQGTYSGWASSQLGLLARAALESKSANFFLFLDEIDKVPKNSQYPPINALYPLIEKNDAKHYRDHWMEVEFDLSRVNIVATANDVRQIDPAILSRFKVFHIANAEFEQLKSAYQSIYQNILQEKRVVHRFAITLSEEALLNLKGATPREARQAIEEGLAAYALSTLDVNETADRLELPASYLCVSQGNVGQKMGFM